MRYRCGAEVCFSIVEAVAVDVVTEKVIGDVNDLAVHPDSFSGLISRVALPADGVRAGGAFCDVPFVHCEAWIVFGVNDSEFAASEGDS